MLGSVGRRLATLLPWVALAWYGLQMYSDYSANLDKTLTYRRPAVAAAPEDVLGLGFWPTWGLVLALMVAVNMLAYALGARRAGILIAVIVVFAAL